MTEDLKIDTPVMWTSSGLTKRGTVIDIVPAGKLPIDINPKYRRVEGSLPRNHTSYIVQGQAQNRPKAIYWPRVSALKPSIALTNEEIEWCKANPKKIRTLIKNQKD